MPSLPCVPASPASGFTCNLIREEKYLFTHFVDESTSGMFQVERYKLYIIHNVYTPQRNTQPNDDVTVPITIRMNDPYVSADLAFVPLNDPGGEITIVPWETRPFLKVLKKGTCSAICLKITRLDTITKGCF